MDQLHLCEELSQEGLDSEKKFKYLSLLKYDSNLSNAAFKEGINIAGLA